MCKQKKMILPILLFTCIFISMLGVVQAAPAGPVGYVDFKYLVDHHPDTPEANKTLQEEQAVLKKEFEEKSVGMSDADRTKLDHQMGQQLEKKRQDLLKVIVNKVVEAVHQVAEEKGLSVVLGKQDVISGGIDITKEVYEKIGEK